MFDIEGSLDRQILAVARTRPTVVFVEPLDPRVLEGACYLARFIRPVFLASEAEVREVAARDLRHVDPTRIEFTFSESVFIEPAKQEKLIARFASALPRGAPRGRPATVGGRGPAGGLGPGAVRDPRREVGARRHGGRRGVARAQGFLPADAALLDDPLHAVCEVGVFVLPDAHPEAIYPHNIVVFGDVGVNAMMTPEALAEVAVGTCAVARDLIPEDVLPEIHGAIVSYSHRGSDEGPSADLVRRAAELIPGSWPSACGTAPATPRSGSRRGEVQRGAVAAVGDVLRRHGSEAGRRHQRDHLPEPRDREPPLPPLRDPVPDAKKFTGHVRRRVPRRRPGHRLHARGRPARGQGVGAPPAARRATGRRRRRTRSSGGTGCSSSTPARRRRRSRVRGRPGDLLAPRSSTPPRSWRRSTGRRITDQFAFRTRAVIATRSRARADDGRSGRGRGARRPAAPARPRHLPGRARRCSTTCGPASAATTPPTSAL